MKLNRKWLMVIALVMSLTMATAGTLAFLTDRDTVENTFTMGNVDIEVEENFPDDEMHPGVEVEKEAGIKNVHKTSDAWVWMTVSVPTDLVKYLDLTWSSDAVKAEAEANVVTNVHEGYTSYVVKHPYKLLPNSSTPKYLQGVTLSEIVDFQNGKYGYVEDGEFKAFDTDLSDLKVIVDGFAMQTEGFANVKAAYDAYVEQWEEMGNGGESGAEGGAEPEAKYGDDDNVTYPAPATAYEVKNTTELLQAIADGKTEIKLLNGTYQWKSNDTSVPNATAARGKTLYLYGESKEGVIIQNTYERGGDAGGDYDFQNSTVYFNGMTIDSSKNDDPNYHGWCYMTATYNDCVFTDGATYTTFNNKHTFNYCTLNIAGDKYNVWTWGANTVTFDHCTFNTDGKALLVYNGSCNLKVSNCKFNDSEALTPVKAAIETGADSINQGVVKHNIEVVNTQVNGFAINTTKCEDVDSTLWANKNGLDHDHLNVVVDGVDVY